MSKRARGVRPPKESFQDLVATPQPVSGYMYEPTAHAGDFDSADVDTESEISVSENVAFDDFENFDDSDNDFRAED